MWVYVKIMHGEGFLVHLVFSLINVQMGVCLWSRKGCRIWCASTASREQKLLLCKTGGRVQSAVYEPHLRDFYVNRSIHKGLITRSFLINVGGGHISHCPGKQFLNPKFQPSWRSSWWSFENFWHLSFCTHNWKNTKIDQCFFLCTIQYSKTSGFLQVLKLSEALMYMLNPGDFSLSGLIVRTWQPWFGPLCMHWFFKTEKVRSTFAWHEVEAWIICACNYGVHIQLGFVFDVYCNAFWFWWCALKFWFLAQFLNVFSGTFLVFRGIFSGPSDKCQKRGSKFFWWVFKPYYSSFHSGMLVLISLAIWELVKILFLWVNMASDYLLWCKTSNVIHTKDFCGKLC